MFIWTHLLLLCSVTKSDSSGPHGLQHVRLLLSSTISQSLLKFISIESVMLSSHLTLCCMLLLCLQSSPASGSFPMSQLFTAGSQCIRASASVLPMNIQGWFPLGLTGLISLQSKELSRVFSSPTTQQHQFFCTQPCSWSNTCIRMWLLEKKKSRWIYRPLLAKWCLCFLKATCLDFS